MSNEDIKESYQVLVVNITYGNELSNKIKDRPEMTVLDIPESILKNKKDETKFKDSIESFVYNTLTRKYGAEVCSCQIWLPFD
jgi:hypothetical protein